jgi:steroid C-25 hydroxylase gamma subunit
VVRVKRITVEDSRLLDPDALDWGSVAQEVVSLDPTPLTSQPSVYVQTSWRDRPYGSLSQLAVRAAHNQRSLFFHLEWEDETEDGPPGDTDAFPDAAAVLFPEHEDAPLIGMGSPQQPVIAWFWRPDFEQPVAVSATGVSTTVRHPDAALKTTGRYQDGRWRVVIARSLESPGAGVINVGPGGEKKVAFAVWQGSGRERAGIKAASMEWEPLSLEP